MGGLMFEKRFICIGSKDHRFVPELMTGATAFVYPVGSSCFRAWILQVWAVDKSAWLAHVPFAAFLRPILAGPPMIRVNRRACRFLQAFLARRTRVTRIPISTPRVVLGLLIVGDSAVRLLVTLGARSAW
jgi:hypothetical protein